MSFVYAIAVYYDPSKHDNYWELIKKVDLYQLYGVIMLATVLFSAKVGLGIILYEAIIWLTLRLVAKTKFLKNNCRLKIIRKKVARKLRYVTYQVKIHECQDCLCVMADNIKKQMKKKGMGKKIQGMQEYQSYMCRTPRGARLLEKQLIAVYLKSDRKNFEIV